MTKNKYKFSFIITILLFVFLLFGYVESVNAMVLRAGEEYKLEKGSTLDDDLYILGEVLNVFGTTTGDILAGGSKIKQDGNIGEDGLFLGATVDVNGNVAGDLRVVGNIVNIRGEINEDLIVAGTAVSISKDAVIKGDVIIFADYFLFEGKIDGLLKVYANVVELKGEVNSPVDVSAKESVSVTGDARLTGGFKYSSPVKAFISDTSFIEGDPEYKTTDGISSSSSNTTFRFIFYVLMMIVASVAVVFVFPKVSENLTNSIVNENKIINIIKAILLIIVWPVLSFILMSTIVGFIPGLMLFLLYLIVLIFSFVLSSVVVGVLLAKLFNRYDERLNFAWVSFGAVVLALFGLLPVFGFVLKLMFLLMSFYVVSFFLYRDIRFKNRRDV